MAEAPNVAPRLDFLPSCETPSGIHHPQESPWHSASIPAGRGHGVPLPPHVLSGGVGAHGTPWGGTAMGCLHAQVQG